MRVNIAVLFLLSSFAAVAQGTKFLTFAEAVNIGLKNNVNIKQEENNLHAARFQSFASQMDFLPVPDVNASGNIGTNRGNSFNQNTGDVINGRFDFVGGAGTLSKTIFQGLNRFYTYRQNKNLLEGQAYNLKWTRETVISDVATQYLACLLDLELLKIAENNVRLQTEQLNKVTEMVNLGSEAEVEKINQEYQVKNASLLLLRAQTALRNSKAELSQLLQLDPLLQIELVEPDWTLKILPDEDVKVEILIEQALENRADIKQASEIESAAENSLRAEKGYYFPSISAFFEYGSRYNFVHNLPEDAPRNRDFDQQVTEDNLQKTYGLSINIPILNGFSTRARVIRSKMDYENRVLANENLVNTIKIDVINAFQNYKDAVKSFDAAKSQLEAAELSYSLEKESFELGASDLLQFTQANQNYIQAQADHAQAYYTLIFQDILLEYATGTLSPEDIPQ